MLNFWTNSPAMENEQSGKRRKYITNYHSDEITDKASRNSKT